MTVKTVIKHTQNDFDDELETLFGIDPTANVLYMGTVVENLPRGAGEQQQQRLHLIAVLKSDL